MKQFEGKTAVVTGAASGIGRALAERFAQARMQVVLADIEKDALDRAVQELEQRQYRVIGVVANTMVRESVEALAKRAIEEFGKVHVVCNNAGIAAMASGMKPIWEVVRSRLAVGDGRELLRRAIRHSGVRAAHARARRRRPHRQHRVARGPDAGRWYVWRQ